MCVITIVAAQTGTTNTKIDDMFDKSSHDFGKLKQSDQPSIYKFQYTNNSDEPLIISGTRASCGCTVAEYSKEPILPGKKGFIKVSYNTKNRPGTFNKNITVTTNLGTKILTIKGVVE